MPRDNDSSTTQVLKAPASFCGYICRSSGREDYHARRPGTFFVPRKITRISGKVFVGAELRGIDVNAHDHLAARPHDLPRPPETRLLE